MNIPIKNPFGSVYGILGILIAVIILIVIIYFIGKQISKGKGEKAEQAAIDKDIQSLIDKGVRGTMSASQVTASANNIANELSKAGWTKSDAFSGVYREILKIKNDADLLNVRKAYGIREINNGLGNVKANPKLTLNESIYLFSPKEVALINEALAKNRVNQRF